MYQRPGQGGRGARRVKYTFRHARRARQARPSAEVRRPSQMVALTLPEEVVRGLRRIDDDIAWAIVHVFEREAAPVGGQRRQRTPSCDDWRRSLAHRRQPHDLPATAACIYPSATRAPSSHSSGTRMERSRIGRRRSPGRSVGAPRERDGLARCRTVARVRQDRGSLPPPSRDHEVERRHGAAVVVGRSPSVIPADHSSITDWHDGRLRRAQRPIESPSLLDGKSARYPQPRVPAAKGSRIRRSGSLLWTGGRQPEETYLLTE